MFLRHTLRQRKLLRAKKQQTNKKPAVGFEYHSCGIRASDREAQCWGADTSGQSTAPEGVAFVRLTAGESYTCGIRDGDGEVVCWGKMVRILWQ